MTERPPRQAVPAGAALRIHTGANPYAAGPCITFGLDRDRESAGAIPPPDGWRRALSTHPALAGEGAVVASVIDAAGRASGVPAAIARLAAALQRAIGHPVADPADAPTGDRVVVPIWDIPAGRDAARFAVAIVMRSRGAAARADDETRQLLDRFLATTGVARVGEDAVRLAVRAAARGIPWARTVPMASIVRLGAGIHQVHFDGGSMSRTSKIADSIAIRKNRAAALMRQHGLPVPRGRAVQSLEDARRAAAEIGYPVVVKPVATDAGTAVHVDIADEVGLGRAYATAARHGAVLVEQMIPGDHTRLLVFQGRFISAMRLDPGRVTGDGRRTVADLIAAANVGRASEVSVRDRRIDVDDEAMGWLGRQGLTLDAVPQSGRLVRLRNGSNLSRGGTAFNVRERVHPDNARLAERAAAVLDLDLAGIDLITPDIARSHREVGGMICEINSGPSLYLREPGYEIEEAVLDGLFGGRQPGRVPIVCLLGEEDAASAGLLAEIDARLAHLPGKRAILTPTRVEIGGWPYLDPPARAHDAGAALLGDPETGAAIVQVAPAVALDEGFAFDRCDLALIPAGLAHTPAARLLAGASDACADPADRPAWAAALARIAEIHASAAG